MNLSLRCLEMLEGEPPGRTMVVGVREVGLLGKMVIRLRALFDVRHLYALNLLELPS